MAREFAGLLWCPIALPPFPYADMDFVEHTDQFDGYDWQCAKITLPNSEPHAATKLDPAALARWPLLEPWLGLLPIRTIRGIWLHCQIAAANPHYDFDQPHVKALYDNNKINEPSGYRVFIKGRRQQGLYLLRNGVKTHVELPHDTDTHVLGATNCLHGVETEPGRKSMHIHLEIDDLRHQELLRTSLARYADYAIWD